MGRVGRESDTTGTRHPRRWAAKFEELIAQREEMVRRLEAQVGLGYEARTALPVHRQVSVKEDAAWRSAVEATILRSFGADALARYHIVWTNYRDGDAQDSAFRIN